MKLAEALINRADAQRRADQLRERLQRAAKVQEGDAPPEQPAELLAEADRTLNELLRLVQAINRTNAATPLPDGRTLTDALAERDVLLLRRGILNSLIYSASEAQNRYMRSEIRMLPTVDVAALQKQADDLARRLRELDTLIQQFNWQVDLIE